MRRSIRLRLQVWYGLVLVAAVGSLAAILYARVRSDRLREVDLGLLAAVQYLDVNLRRFPPHELDEHLPPGPLRSRPPEPPFEETFPPPGPPSPERLLAELDLPRPIGPHRPRGPIDTIYLGVWRNDGSLLKGVDLPPDRSAPQTEGARPVFAERNDCREAAARGPWGTRVLVGQSLRPIREELQSFAQLLVLVSGVVLGIGLAGGWVISARILRPMASIAATAAAISETNLSQRIDALHVDRELSDLAEVLNRTFARLEEAFARQVRFTADASHELRTPLAIIRSQTELALARPRDVEHYQEALRSCLRAAERMATLVESLLTLARIDAGKLQIAQESVNLRPVIEETLESLRPVADAKNIQVEASLAPVEIRGDAERLAQVVSNLVCNAIEHREPGGWVKVEVGVAEGSALLTVEDNGPGIPEADRAHIFERFFRTDKARSRRTGGHGLGLAICKSLVEAHGGTLDFEPRRHGGSVFRARFPTTQITALISDAQTGSSR